MIGPAPASATTPAACLVVEDELHTREWLVEVVHAAFGTIPVALAGDVASARSWLRRCGPGAVRAEGDASARLVVLVDLGLPDGSGLDILRDLADAHPAALPVVTTIYDDAGHLMDALAAGAGGYLLKDHDTATMAALLRRIHAGEPPLSPAMARRLLAHFRHPPSPPADARTAGEGEPPRRDLTPREAEVLALLGRGLRTGEAAQVLGVSEHTVASHVKAIYAKLNISSRAEAALEARNRGLA